ncbi:MAG: hypothetical protein LBI16_00915, partial [Burkholderiales bacterium]|nr:hypothetical protein [Burkholderiales bacterium]
GRRSIPWDSAQEFYPALAFAAQQLREGSFPWWNPYLFAGYPQFADPQAMTFQPSVVLPLLLSDLPSITWFNTVIVLHVLLAGFGALTLARSYRLSPLAQLLFALTFMYGGVAASRMQHTPMLISYCFLPWLWWGLRRLVDRPDWRSALIVGIGGGLCALQLTQVTYLIALLMGGYALWLLSQSPSEKRWRSVGAMAAALLVSLLLSSPQWLSTLAFLPFSNRAELSLAEAVGGSLWPASLATLLAGNVFSHTIGTYWGPGDITTDYLYVGIVPLVAWLFWGGGSKYRGERHDEHCGERRFWSVVLLLSLLYAVGTHTLFYERLHYALPGLTLFRRPADALFLAMPALSLLGAMALNRRLTGQPTRPNGFALVAAGVLLAYTFWIVLAAHRPQALLALLYSAATAGVLLWLLRYPSRPAATGTLLVILLLCVLDLRLHNVAHRFNAHKNQELRLYRSSPAPTEAALIARLQAGIERTAIPERVELFWLPVLVNGAGVFGIGNISGYNPMLYSRYVRMFGVNSEPPNLVEQRTFTDWAPDFSAHAFDLLGLREVVNRDANGVIHSERRKSVLPRILTPTEIRVHEDDLPPAEAFRSTDFSQTLWLPAEEAENTACRTSSAGKLYIGTVKYTSNATTIEYTGEAPAWLVLNEIHMPGWYARIGGEEIPLLRGNGMFRTMCVPAGSHQLTVAFNPLRFLAAGWRAYRSQQ